MYSLYLEHVSGDLRYLCGADLQARAFAYAAHWSKAMGGNVVVVREFEDGATTVVATYQQGRAMPEVDGLAPQQTPPPSRSLATGH